MFAKKLKWGVYLCAVAGFLSLGVLPGYSRLLMLGFLLALIPGWFISQKVTLIPHYSRAWNIASLLFLVFTSLLMFFGDLEVHLIFAYQISFLQVAKSFTAGKTRDGLWMWLFAFLMFVISAITTTEAFYPFLLVFFLFCTFYTFFWMSVRRERDQLQDFRKQSTDSGRFHVIQHEKDIVSQAGLFASYPAWKKYRRALNLYSIICVILTAMIFLLFPRLGSKKYGPGGFYRGNNVSNMALTGFAGGIHLGSLRNIAMDHTPVMDVKIKGGLSGETNLYLKGAVFNIFKDQSWTKSRSLLKYEAFQVDPKSHSVEFSEYKLSDSPVIEQTVQYLKFPTRHLFVIGDLIKLGDLDPGFFDVIYGDKAGSYFLKKSNITKYKAWSRRTSFSPVGSYGAPDLSKEEIESYLNFPDELDRGKIKTLAERIIGRAASEYEKASRIESYLYNEYDYTTRVGVLRGDSPVEDFLFTVKSGHCELFATSMIMLLRSLDVPCRLVVGFHGGEYKAVENRYLIRQSDAHSWVEVLDPKKGWRLFDPTPSGPMTVYSGRLYFKKLSDFLSRISRGWQEFVLGYNARFQDALAGRTVRFLRKGAKILVSPVSEELNRSRAFARFKENMKHSFFWIMASFLMILNGLVWVIYFRFRRKRGRIILTGKGRTGKLINYWYLQIVKTVNGKYVQKPLNETMKEFVMNLGCQNEMPLSVLNESCDILYAMRYEREADINLYVKRLQELLRDLRDVKIK